MCPHLAGSDTKGRLACHVRSCGFDVLVGYLQAAVSLLHLPKGIIEAQGEDLRRCGNTCSQEDDE